MRISCREALDAANISLAALSIVTMKMMMEESKMMTTKGEDESERNFFIRLADSPFFSFTVMAEEKPSFPL